MQKCACEWRISNIMISLVRFFHARRTESLFCLSFIDHLKYTIKESENITNK